MNTQIVKLDATAIDGTTGGVTATLEYGDGTAVLHLGIGEKLVKFDLAERAARAGVLTLSSLLYDAAQAGVRAGSKGTPADAQILGDTRAILADTKTTLADVPVRSSLDEQITD